MIHDNRWNLGGCRNQIIHKAGIDKLPLFIVYEPFKKCSSNALRYTTMYLSLDDHRINHAPAVMHRRIFDECDHARFRVNLDDSSVDTAGKTCVWWAIKLAGL